MGKWRRFNRRGRSELLRNDDDGDAAASVPFRIKEKVIVTCSRRITFRCRHLMLDVVSLFPHCKKSNKVESKETKGATLDELVKLRNCSSCLFFEFAVQEA